MKIPENPDGKSPMECLAYLHMCAASWEPDARLLGNLRAGDIVRSVDAIAQGVHEPMVHGTYPHDRNWTIVCTLPWQIVCLILGLDKDGLKYYMNKGYTIIHTDHIKGPIAVYKHDFQWYLIILPHGGKLRDHERDVVAELEMKYEETKEDWVS